MRKPDIFEYLDLRQYLSDIYKFRKNSEYGFSYEKWAGEMEFRSRAYLRALVIGEKPLHESLLLPLTKSLQLDVERTDYLTMLLRYSLAPSPELKESYGRQLMQKWKVYLQQATIVDIAEFLSDAMIPVIFTYLSFKDASSDLQTMAKVLSCDVQRIQNCLRCLIWQKLVDGSVDEQGQIHYQTVQPFFSVPSQVGSGFIKSFHKEGLKLAENAIEKPSSERKCYATFVAMNEEQFGKFQEMIQDFNQRVLGTFDSPERGDKRIYRLNTQIFAVSS
jgi:uncharacterized protein (TIGR02147 family)